MMELLAIQHGANVNIHLVSKHTNNSNAIDTISIELSPLLNYPFPTVLLSQLGMTILSE